MSLGVDTNAYIVSNEEKDGDDGDGSGIIGMAEPSGWNTVGFDGVSVCKKKAKGKI